MVTLLRHNPRSQKAAGSIPNEVSGRIPPSVILRRVALVRTVVSEVRIGSILRVTGYGDQGTTFLPSAQ
jgi:hypothetical protein